MTSRRTHPPALIRSTARTIKDESLFAHGDCILVAVSGGPDSMALLHVLSILRREFGNTLVAHGVNHGLRVEAAAELDRAEAFANDLGVPFGRSNLELEEGGNLQSRARTARYDALHSAAREVNATRIATAHHADDRAETFLLRLLRGAGPRGLAVLPPRSGARIRPFIRAAKTDIDGHVARHNVPSGHDPSNLDARFLRTRVRREVLPLLQSMSPSIVEHICAVADQLESETRDVEARALPRATLNAMARGAKSKSEKARILLPGGLVAAYDRAHDRWMLSEVSSREEVENTIEG